MYALGIHTASEGFALGAARHFTLVEKHARVPLDLLFCCPPSGIFSQAMVSRANHLHLGMPEVWRECFAYLTTYQPKIWVLEASLRAYTNGRELVDHLTHNCLQHGYSVTHALTNSAWFGLPQRRKRLFLIAHQARTFRGLDLMRWDEPPTVGAVLAQVPEPGMIRGRHNYLIPAYHLTPPGRKIVNAWERIRPRRGARPSTLQYRLDADSVAQAYPGDLWWHPAEPRKLGINEAKALCGFPPEFPLAGSRHAQSINLAAGSYPPMIDWLAGASRLTVEEGEPATSPTVTLLNLDRPNWRPVDLTEFYENKTVGVITILVDENPRRRGSQAHKTFALYRNGMTVNEFLEKGGTRIDLEWDIQRHHVAVGASQASPAHSYALEDIFDN